MGEVTSGVRHRVGSSRAALDSEVSAMLERRLAGFLSRYDLAVEDLRAEVEHVFGEPCAVVAAGSILEGFGNEHSDVDLCVIVERQNLTQLPIMSYRNTARIDVTYLNADEVADSVEAVRGAEWPPPPLNPQAWRRQRSRLRTLGRLAAGLVLSARDGWEARLAELRAGWRSAPSARSVCW